MKKRTVKRKPKAARAKCVEKPASRYSYSGSDIADNAQCVRAADLGDPELSFQDYMEMRDAMERKSYDALRVKLDELDRHIGRLHQRAQAIVRWIENAPRPAAGQMMIEENQYLLAENAKMRETLVNHGLLR